MKRSPQEENEEEEEQEFDENVQGQEDDGEGDEEEEEEEEAAPPRRTGKLMADHGVIEKVQLTNFMNHRCTATLTASLAMISLAFLCRSFLPPIAPPGAPSPFHRPKYSSAYLFLLLWSGSVPLAALALRVISLECSRLLSFMFSSSLAIATALLN